MALPVHGQGERIGGVLPAFIQRILDHLGVHGAVLFRLALGHRAQVHRRRVQSAGNTQVVHAVDRLGAGHFLEHLGNFRMAFF